MANTDARRRAARKYLSESVEEIRVRVPKGAKDSYKEAAADRNLSLNQFAVKAMDHVIQNDIPLDETSGGSSSD